MKTFDVIAHFKTQAKTGAALGCDQSAVSLWGDYPPDARQLQVERLTGGTLKAEPGCLDRVLGMDKIPAGDANPLPAIAEQPSPAGLDGVEHRNPLAKGVPPEFERRTATEKQGA